MVLVLSLFSTRTKAEIAVDDLGLVTAYPGGSVLPRCTLSREERFVAITLRLTCASLVVDIDKEWTSSRPLLISSGWSTFSRRRTRDR